MAPNITGNSPHPASSMQRAGCDFAGGTMAGQGAAMGAEILATFDRDGSRLLNANGLAAAEPAQLLSVS